MATIASLLADRVTLQVRSVDRLFLQGYVPKLMSEGLICRFLIDRGYTIPSPALLGRIGRGYVQAIERYAARHAVPVVRLAKGVSKEEVARPFLRAAEREGRVGVVMIGVAQERASAFRGWRTWGTDAHPHFAYRRQQVYVNHYYFYLRDPEWGPAFIKCCPYAPYPIWLWLNGHEWAKRQAEAAGIAYVALDNGFRSCAQDARARRDLRPPGRRGRRALPAPLGGGAASPFTLAERERGYRHRLAFRQLELSDTRVFDRPQAGREWFEQMIRDQLTLGRPDRVAIVFGRGQPQDPGRFLTQVVTRGVEPAIQVHYKLQGQAVPQGGPRPSDRDHGQRHPRLRDRAPLSSENWTRCWPSATTSTSGCWTLNRGVPAARPRPTALEAVRAARAATPADPAPPCASASRA